MEALKWKIVAQAPFGGLAPKYYKNTYHTYWQANQFNAMNDVDMSDLTSIKQAPALAAYTVVNSYSTPVNTYQTIVNILDKKVWTLGYAISAWYIWSINTTTHTLTAIHNLPAGATGKSLSYYDGNLYYFYNTASASDIGKYDLISAWTDDWGSTQVADPVNVFRQGLTPVSSDSLVKMIIGNGKDIGLYDGTSLSMQAVEWDANDLISTIVSTETLTFVGYNGVLGGLISVFSNEFSPTDSTGAITPILPDATIMLKNATIWTMFYENGITYVIYLKSGKDAFTLWYVNGSILSDLFDISGTLPTHNQISYINDQLTFISSGVVYQYGKQDTTTNFAINPYHNLANASALANVAWNLLVASSAWLYYESWLAITCSASSLTFVCSDVKHLGFVDNIQVRTNSLASDAWCTVSIYRNKWLTADDVRSFVIDWEWRTRHFSQDVKMWGCEEIKYVVTWTNGSATNNCNVREIIINGHLNERGWSNI